jgi:hypothetical protein
MYEIMCVQDAVPQDYQTNSVLVSDNLLPGWFVQIMSGAYTRVTRRPVVPTNMERDAT